jgi:hypothetical protein
MRQSFRGFLGADGLPQRRNDEAPIQLAGMQFLPALPKQGCQRPGHLRIKTRRKSIPRRYDPGVRQLQKFK